MASFIAFSFSSTPMSGLKAIIALIPWGIVREGITWSSPPSERAAA